MCFGVLTSSFGGVAFCDDLGMEFWMEFEVELINVKGEDALICI